MKALIFCGIIYCIVKIIGKLNEREKQNRIVREQETIKAEQLRQKDQIRAEIERAKLETKERIEAEKRRIEWQKRQDEINARLEKEQERQAAILEKNEAETRKAQFTADQALSDIGFQNDRLADLESQLDYLLLLQAGTVPGSKEHDKYQKRIVTLHNQIHTAESKLNKAKFCYDEAKRKLV